MSGLPDISDFFKRYELILAEADALFGRVRAEYPECVKCGQGCSDCCHALFDLPLIEAMYINKSFVENFDYGPERSAILEEADSADRKIHKIKRKIFKDSQAGIEGSEIMQEVSRIKIRCPLLGKDDTCLMYDKRPVTCRIYGIPTRIGSEAHCCGKSAFNPGTSYPTVDLGKLHAKLELLSQELAAELKSSYIELDKVFVPLSLALLNRYDAEYLGIKG